jgi:hypothetical protein
LLEIVSRLRERERSLQMLQLRVVLAVMSVNPRRDIFAARTLRLCQTALFPKVLDGCLSLIDATQFLEKFNPENFSIEAVQTAAAAMQVVQRICETALVREPSCVRQSIHVALRQDREDSTSC